MRKRFGYSCWGRTCKRHVSAWTKNKAARRATRSGWVFGHHDGQTHISCPECKPGLMGVYGTMNEFEGIK